MVAAGNGRSSTSGWPGIPTTADDSSLIPSGVTEDVLRPVQMHHMPEVENN